MAQRWAGASWSVRAEGQDWLLCGLVVALGAVLFTVSPVPGQQPDPQARSEYCRWKDFQIPFGASDPRIARVHLYVSEDLGRTWLYRTTATPSQGHKYFEFHAERDGWFWFAVQTEDSNRQLNPAKIDAQTPPSLKVCVDTLAPRVTLQAIAAPAGQAGVSWIVQDDNLNNLKQGKVGTLVLEYRVAGRDLTWTPVPADQKAVGQAFWNAPGAGPLDVHLRVSDDAGNSGEVTAQVTPGATGPGGVVTGGGSGSGPASPTTSALKRQFTNSKRVNLKYSLQDVGKSGVSVIEVWNTTDGRSWQLLKPWRDIPKELDKPLAIPLTFDREGLYGFTLIPRSGVGRGAAGPQTGDDAQIWIEYDATPPVVRLSTVEVGRGADDGKLLISWTADDKNMDRTDPCITLSYAEDAKGPWIPFARDLANDGFTSWKMDATTPFQFYVRVEAKDKAGNVGKADTLDRVKVDLNQPKAQVSGIEALPVSP